MEWPDSPDCERCGDAEVICSHPLRYLHLDDCPIGKGECYDCEYIKDCPDCTSKRGE